MWLFQWGSLSGNSTYVTLLSFLICLIYFPSRPIQGYHSNYNSRYYPNTFDYISLFSPALNSRYEDHPAARAYQNLNDLNKLISNGYKLYRVGIGKNDFPILFNAVQDFRKKPTTRV